jgi:hypothetical protein
MKFINPVRIFVVFIIIMFVLLFTQCSNPTNPQNNNKTSNNSPEYPVFSTVPYAIGMAIDDLGWRNWIGDEGRDVTLTDYQNIIEVGKNCNTRIMTAWLLRDLDPDTIITNYTINDGTYTYLLTDWLPWNNSGNLNSPISVSSLMTKVKDNAAYLEFGIHGVSHEHYRKLNTDPDIPASIKMSRSEFAQFEDESASPVVPVSSWGQTDMLTHLNCFEDIMRHYFDANTSSFPKSMVPPGHGYFYDGSVNTTGNALASKGVKYVNGGTGVCTTLGEGGIDNGVIFIDRAYGANYNTLGQTAWYGSWNDFQKPDYPDESYGWVEAHFPNYWSRTDFDAVVEWTIYLKGLNNSDDRFLPKNTEQCSSQWLYKRYTAITKADNTTFLIDNTGMVTEAYSYDLLGNLVIKTPIGNKHISSAAIDNNAQIVGYYETHSGDYNYGYLIIGHKTNPMGRLSAADYNLTCTLGSDTMPEYIDQTTSTYNVYSFTTTSTTATVKLEMYGTQDVKIKLPFTPNILSITSDNSDLKINGTPAFTSPFLTINVTGADIQGEVGTISISE